MKRLLSTTAAIILCLSITPSSAKTLKELNETLFGKLKQVHRLSDAEMSRIKQIFARSGVLGQGNPAITKHALTEAQCRANSGNKASNGKFDRICGDRFMAPLYDPATQRPEDAKSCIDQYEFPNIPCTYPVVWVKASEAAAICEAQGKRMCDAHEWEGACQGSLGAADYRFDLAKGASASGAVNRMRAAHNRKYGATKRWSYGGAYQAGVCAANSQKSSSCPGGGYRNCGSNTYPTGSFKNCVSPLKVYDLNGNAAEHMNLPLSPSQMASKGSKSLGVTEMKGSWFIFDKYRAHPDWCRWRAPFWHGTKVKSSASHENYHLGFRCCKSVN
jgi:hypothetical protein